MNSIKKLAIPVVIVLVVLIAGISIVSYLGSEIDLTEYIEIETVHGLNGQGVLEYRLNTSDLTDFLYGEISGEEITEENFEAVMAANIAKFEEIEHAIDCISITADKETGLSNGDTVTITAAFENAGDHKLSYHFKDGSKTYTVSGLIEGQSVDPFSEEAVSVTFSGLSGQGEAVLEILSQDEPFSLFSYNLSQAYELSNGDEITLAVNANEKELEEKGYFLPEVSEKIYVVSGLGEYFDFSNEFPASEINSLCDKALAASKEMEAVELADGYMVTSPSKIHKVFSMKIKDPTTVHVDYGYNVQLDNAICIVTSYYVEGTGFMPLSREEWSIWIYPNYFINGEGTLSHEEEKDYDLWTTEDSIDTVLSWLYDEYGDMTIAEVNLA